MKRPLILLPLLALAAVQCLAQDHATNAPVLATASETMPFVFYSKWDETSTLPRVRCGLINETDDNWFIFVDDDGRIEPVFDSPSEDESEENNDSIRLSFKEEEVIPQGVLWVQHLYPSRSGTGTETDVLLDSWDWRSIPSGGKKTGGMITVRAVNWQHWIETVDHSQTNTFDTAVDDGLRWKLDWAGTNLILSVENRSELPRLLHVFPEGVNGKPGYSNDPRTFGPFLLGANIRIGPTPNLWQIVRTGGPAPRGIYRVLHGRQAPEESRTQSFIFGAARRVPSPGTVVSCDVRFDPFVIYPLDDWGETNQMVDGRHRELHFSITTNLVVRLDNFKENNYP